MTVLAKRLVASLLGATLLLSGLGSAQALAAGSGPFPKPAEAAAKERIWQDERIYFVFLDRFHNGDPSNDGTVNLADPRAWHGGDLKGVIDKLDYIKQMGFTAIWITPHVKNTGRDYHGYGAIDFFDTDPHFGTIADAKNLVEQAHKKGIKVLFDIVVNHTGPSHPLVREKPDWFHPQMAISDWNNDQQVQQGWIFNLPDFDQSKPEVRDYILEYSKFWIDQTGVDGFRLDTVKHVDPAFFTWYSGELQKIKPGFWLMGEVWLNSPFKLATYQQAGVTALLDFPVGETARKAFATDAGLSSVATMVSQVERTMPDASQMATFLDNHDMPRFASVALNDPVNRLKLGLTFLFTQRSIPILYYGTEIAMPGGQDPMNRNDFPWGKETNTDVRDLVTKLNTIREQHIALRRGAVTNLAADQWRYAYARTLGQDQVVVVLNNHGSEGYTAEVDVTKAGIADGTVLTDELSGTKVTVTGGKMAVNLGARSGAIFATATGAAGAGSMSVLAGVGVAVAVAGVVGAFAYLRRRQRRQGRS